MPFRKFSLYSRNLQLVKRLKEVYAREPVDDEDKKKRRAYRAIKGSFTVILNFYSSVTQLYAEEVIDRRMFLNSFADSFMKLWNAMPALNAIVDGYPPERLKDVESFKNICALWVEQKKKSGVSSE